MNMEWRSVKDELPAPTSNIYASEWVLAYYTIDSPIPFNGISICRYNSFDGYWIREKDNHRVDVSHWMNLPSPPTNSTTIEQGENRQEDERELYPCLSPPFPPIYFIIKELRERENTLEKD